MTFELELTPERIQELHKEVFGEDSDYEELTIAEAEAFLASGEIEDGLENWFDDYVVDLIFNSEQFGGGNVEDDDGEDEE